MTATDEALRIIIAGLRSIADDLEQLGERGGQPAAAAPLVPNKAFDPEIDVPDVKPVPNDGTRDQLDWCGLIFFSRLRAINVRQHRGATPQERVAIARAAGYRDARAYSGWTWTWEDREDGRWITDDDDLIEEDKAKGRLSGVAFMRHYAEALDRVLPDDIA